MIIVLPIISTYSNKESLGNNLLSVLPIDLKLLAEMVLYFNNDKEVFFSEVFSYISDLIDYQSMNDNDLTAYNDSAIFNVLKSHAFKLFLHMFYDEHRELYNNVLGINPDHFEFRNRYDTSTKTKLVIDAYLK